MVLKDNTMKILQDIPYFCFGGAETMCENLTYALKEMDNLDVITFPYGPSAEYGKTVSAYRSNQIRYLSTPITEDIEQLGKFVNVWFEELEDMPKENIIDDLSDLLGLSRPTE